MKKVTWFVSDLLRITRQLCSTKVQQKESRWPRRQRNSWRIQKPSQLKRFMSIFCKRRGADNFFLMDNLPAVSVFTFYLFWVKAPLSQFYNEGERLRTWRLLSSVYTESSNDNWTRSNASLSFAQWDHCDNYSNR